MPLPCGLRKDAANLSSANHDEVDQPLPKGNELAQFPWANRVHKLFEKNKSHDPDITKCLKVTCLDDVEKIMETMHLRYQELHKAKLDYEDNNQWEIRIDRVKNNIGNFMQSYSGICEVAKSAAGAKAEVPYAALSVIFIVSNSINAKLRWPTNESIF